MNSVIQAAAVPGETTSPGRAVSTQVSKVMPSLFHMLEVNHRLTVLEVGTALPETVEFFSRYKCRIHFVDLFSAPLVRELQGVTGKEEMRQKFAELLDLPDGTRLDLCLFWDFLCYLDDPALRAFNEALRPCIHHGTRAHGFGVHHLAIKLGNQQYGIEREDLITFRPRHSEAMPSYPHTQVEMHDFFSCFDFERGMLLPDGKLELLLKARDLFS